MKVKRFVACILAAMFMLGAFTLIGCTDKNKPRELNDVEKAFVGTWANYLRPERSHHVFHDDGTYDYIAYADDGTLIERYSYYGVKFYYYGEGNEPKRGHYYIVRTEKNSYWAMFDSDKNSIYNHHSDDMDKVNGQRHIRVAE